MSANQMTVCIDCCRPKAVREPSQNFAIRRNCRTLFAGQNDSVIPLFLIALTASNNFLFCEIFKYYLNITFLFSFRQALVVLKFNKSVCTHENLHEATSKLNSICNSIKTAAGSNHKLTTNSLSDSCSLSAEWSSFFSHGDKYLIDPMAKSEQNGPDAIGSSESPSFMR
jgi:hypothetical protein